MKQLSESVDGAVDTHDENEADEAVKAGASLGSPSSCAGMALVCLVAIGL